MICSGLNTNGVQAVSCGLNTKGLNEYQTHSSFLSSATSYSFLKVCCIVIHMYTVHIVNMMRVFSPVYAFLQEVVLIKLIMLEIHDQTNVWGEKYRK